MCYKDVHRFESELLRYMRGEHNDVLNAIRDQGFRAIQKITTIHVRWGILVRVRKTVRKIIIGLLAVGFVGLNERRKASRIRPST